MKTKKFLWLLLISFATVAISLSFTTCNDDDPKVVDPDTPDTPDNPGPGPVDPTSVLPDSIKNGSDFYCIYLGDVETGELGSKVVVPTMFRDYDIWPAGESLAFAERLGINAFGCPEGWTSFDHNSWAEAWNGGGFIAVLDEFGEIPDLSALDGSYTFHFAIKSPTNQTTAGTILIFYSQGQEVKYYFGPQNQAPSDATYGGNYPHDGEWHHFEIPVSELMAQGYLWTGPLSDEGGRAYLLGFMGEPHMPGTQLDLDAIFFYKKPAN